MLTNEIREVDRRLSERMDGLDLRMDKLENRVDNMDARFQRDLTTCRIRSNTSRRTWRC